MSKDVLKAIYETKRDQLIIAYKNHDECSYISDSYIYAYYCRMCPVFELSDDIENDPFHEVYDIKKDFIMSLLDYLGDIYNDEQKKTPSFRMIECEFGGYKVNRMEIVFVLRYFFLNSFYDEDFYKDILRESPVEANGINRPLEASEIYL